MSNLGRPLEFNPDVALDAAIDVFWRQGYEATSVTDLLEAMALSKSSLYQTFGSKQQLFERCVVRYADRLSANMTKELAEANSGLSYIRNTFESIANTAQEPDGAKGCLVGNSANEFGQKVPAMALPVSYGMQKFSKIFVDAVVQGQADGSISSNTDPHTLANYLQTAMNGLRMMIKAGMDKNSAKGLVTMILKAIN